jgi:hypothetical protein
VITLQDPQTGALVHLTQPQLPQRCQVCQMPLLESEWACSTEDRGWCCLSHLERVLLALPTSPEFRAKDTARKDLTGLQPGDTVKVTGSLLAALGAA